MSRAAGEPAMRVAPSPPVRALPLDFSATSELIDGAERLTGEWLDAGAPLTVVPGTS